MVTVNKYVQKYSKQDAFATNIVRKLHMAAYIQYTYSDIISSYTTK